MVKTWEVTFSFIVFLLKLQIIKTVYLNPAVTVMLFHCVKFCFLEVHLRAVRHEFFKNLSSQAEKVLSQC